MMCYSHSGRLVQRGVHPARTALVTFMALGGLLGASRASLGATVTLGASRDATIYSNHVDRGSGGGNALITGTNGQDDPRRALIAFDVASAVPAGSVIQSVTMKLVLGQLPTEPTPISVINAHRVLADWGEGTTQQQIPPNDSFGGMGQGAPANLGDVTWIASFWGPTPTYWNQPGGDFSTVASTSAAVGLPIDVAYTWPSTSAAVNDAQSWLDDPSSNFGWMLVNSDEIGTSTFRVFYSRHVATAAWRPQLEITYIPEPASVLLCVLACFPLVRGARIRSARS
jgi:hypothetical protein